MSDHKKAELALEVIRAQLPRMSGSTQIDCDITRAAERLLLRYLKRGEPSDVGDSG